MRGVIAFSLYGEHVDYDAGAIQNIRDAKVFYPGWQCHFWMPQGYFLADRIKAEGGFVHYIESGFPPMCGRLLALDEAAFRAAGLPIIFRDTDSRFSSREAEAVQEWIQSGMSCHTMRDDPMSHYHFPIMGGMWGIQIGSLQDSAIDTIKSNAVKDVYGDDEKFLTDWIWPRFSRAMLIHCSYGDTGTRAFPSPTAPQGTRFIGAKVKPDVRSSNVGMFCLNPSRYVNRWKNFQSQSETSSLLRSRMERFEGTPIDASPMPSDWPSDGRKVLPHHWPATLDHKRMIDGSLKSDMDVLIVFEDDAEITDGFDAHFSTLWELLPWGWYGAWLGGYHVDVPDRVMGVPEIIRLKGATQCHAYMLNRQGMRACSDYLSGEGGSLIIDWAFREVHKRNGRFFGPSKFFVNQSGAQEGNGS